MIKFDQFGVRVQQMRELEMSWLTLLENSQLFCVMPKVFAQASFTAVVFVGWYVMGCPSDGLRSMYDIAG